MKGGQNFGDTKAIGWGQKLRLQKCLIRRCVGNAVTSGVFE